MWFYLSNFQLPCEPHDSVIGNTWRTPHVAEIFFFLSRFSQPSRWILTIHDYLICGYWPWTLEDTVAWKSRPRWASERLIKTLFIIAHQANVGHNINELNNLKISRKCKTFIETQINPIVSTISIRTFSWQARCHRWTHQSFVRLCN